MKLNVGKYYKCKDGAIKGPAKLGIKIRGKQTYEVGQGGHDGAYMYYENGKHVYGRKDKTLVEGV